jgi:hypothetical protein
MKPKSSTSYRNIVVIVFFILAAIVAGIAVLTYTTRPVTNLESAGVEANQLIASVGGPAKVCDEAKAMFKRFGIMKEKFLSPSELMDYPAIAALGAAHVILPDSPPRISIRVGTHLNGFFIEIVDTNSPGKYAKLPDILELVDYCVFVHR